MASLPGIGLLGGVVRTSQALTLAALDRALASSFAQEVVDRLVASPLVELTVRRVLQGPEIGRVVELVLESPRLDEAIASAMDSPAADRLARQAIESAAVERLVTEALESPGMERLVARILDSPGMERLVNNAIDSRLGEETMVRLIEEITERLIASRGLWLLVDEVAASPAIADAITAQSLGFADQVTDEVRDRSRSADAWLENVARRVLRRRAVAGPLPPTVR
jgi:hypothetical protein